METYCQKLLISEKPIFLFSLVLIKDKIFIKPSTILLFWFLIKFSFSGLLDCFKVYPVFNKLRAYFNLLSSFPISLFLFTESICSKIFFCSMIIILSPKHSIFASFSFSISSLHNISVPTFSSPIFFSSLYGYSNNWIIFSILSLTFLFSLSNKRSIKKSIFFSGSMSLIRSYLLDNNIWSLYKHNTLFNIKSLYSFFKLFLLSRIYWTNLVIFSLISFRDIFSRCSLIINFLIIMLINMDVL